MNNSVKHIALLDYIRAIAILTVMLDHTLTVVYGYETLPWAGWFRDLSSPVTLVYLLPMNLGLAGVAIFFFVSGFCIHLSFQQQGQKWGSFFVRRIFRIYPAYLAALIFFTVFLMEQPHLSLHGGQVVTHFGLEIPHPAGEFAKQVFTHLFLVHNVYPDTFSGITGAFWSLAVEAQLYLLYPVLVLMVAKLGWRRALTILAVCELLIRGDDAITQTWQVSGSMGGIIAGFLFRSPFGYWFSWSLGAYVADAFLKKQPLPFRNTSLSWWIVLALAAYMVKPLYSFYFLLCAVITAIAAAKLLSREQPQTKTPALPLQLLSKIGLWSYSLYLIHQPLLKIYTYGIGWLLPVQHQSISLSFMAAFLGWLAVIPFAVLWYKLLELPGIAWGKRIIRKMDAPNAALFEPQRTQESARRRPLAIGLTLVALVIFVLASFWVNMKLKPTAVQRNNLAWFLATSPRAADRNGALAVKLAKEACEETQFQQTAMVGTLAAAFAEDGQFGNAVSAAQMAIALASQSGDRALLQKNQQLLQLYQNHQPYREKQ